MFRLKRNRILGKAKKSPYNVEGFHHYDYLNYFSHSIFKYAGMQLKLTAPAVYYKNPEYSYQDKRIAEWAMVQIKVNSYLNAHDFQAIYHERAQQLAYETDKLWKFVFEASKASGDDFNAMWRELGNNLNTFKWEAFYRDLQALASSDASTSAMATFFEGLKELDSPANREMQTEMDEAYREYHKLNVRYLTGNAPAIHGY